MTMANIPDILSQQPVTTYKPHRTPYQAPTNQLVTSKLEVIKVAVLLMGQDEPYI